MLEMANQPSIAILGEQYPRSWFYVNQSSIDVDIAEFFHGIRLTGALNHSGKGTLKIYSPMTFFIDAMTSAG